MKNLKKALVLVLAFAMVFSLFTFNASAATSFNDDEDIVNKEAVSAMAQLGIINGYEDGTFLPKQVVTRAEMCKMICIALNGGVEPLLDSGANVFSDTAGHWASKYINYCYSMGIVSGDSGKGGAFRPDAPVTALEAAKMMLVALGYNSTAAGFTGADWAQNVAKEANRKGLFDGIGALNANAGLSRDNAAQLIFNGINAEMVEYENTLGMENGQLVTIPKIKDLAGKTIISEKYKAIRVEGVVTDNEFLTPANKGKTALTITNDAAITAFGATDTFVVSTGADVVGKSVVLYVKPSTTAPADGQKATVIGNVAISTANKVFATNKAIASANVEKTLAAEGLKIDSANDIKLYANYSVSTVSTPAATAFANNLGVETQFIDNNGDGIVDVVIQLTYAFGKVSDVATTGNGKLTVSELGRTSGLTLNTTTAKDDVVNFANLGLAKDDYVKFYKVGTKFYVEKVTGVTVNVTAIKGNNVIASGVTYEKSYLANATDMAEADNAQATLADAVNIGKNAVFFLDGAGAVIYVANVATAPTTTNYLMILDVSTNYGAFNDTVTVKVVHDDGTIATVNVSKVGSTAVTSNASTVADSLKKITDGATAVIYSYKLDKDGKYELTAQTTKMKADANPSNPGDVAFENNKPVIKSDIIADASTVFVLGNTNKDSFKVYKGIAAVPSTNDAPVFAVTNNDKIAKVVFTYGGTNAATVAGDYIYILDATPTVTKDGDNDVYTYDVIRDGAVTTIVATSDGKTAIDANTGLYLADLKNGKVDDIDDTDSRIIVGDATTAKNGIIGVNDGSTDSYYVYNDSTVVFVIEDGKATVASISDIKASDDVSILLDKDGEIAEYIFIAR